MARMIVTEEIEASKMVAEQINQFLLNEEEEYEEIIEQMKAREREAEFDEE